jgi:IstB-like ATP binding protein
LLANDSEHQSRRGGKVSRDEYLSGELDRALKEKLSATQVLESLLEIFADQVVAGAIVDRLLHKASVLSIRGKSYRMRAHQDHAKEGGAVIVR